MKRGLGSLVLTLHHTPARWSFSATATGVPALRRIFESLLADGYRFVDLAGCEPDGPPPGSIALTVDDGYESNARHLAPLLRKLGIPWTVFVLVGSLGQANQWDLPLVGTQERHLTEEEIARLSEEGVAIGSHGMTHRDFRALGDAALDQELHRSLEALAGLTKRPVDALAYPRGRVDERVARAAGRAGFRIGFGSGRVPELPGDLRALSQRRIGLYAPDQIPGIFHWTAIRGPRPLRSMRSTLAWLGDALIATALKTRGGRDA